MDEKFTWECLWAMHCGECQVAQFVKDRELGEGEQEDLMNLATAASFLYRRGMSREELMQSLHPGDSPVNGERLAVAVDGFLQWANNDCRPTARMVLRLAAM